MFVEPCLRPGTNVTASRLWLSTCIPDPRKQQHTYAYHMLLQVLLSGCSLNNIPNDKDSIVPTPLASVIAASSPNAAHLHTNHVHGHFHEHDSSSTQCAWWCPHSYGAHATDRTAHIDTCRAYATANVMMPVAPILHGCTQAVIRQSSHAHPAADTKGSTAFNLTNARDIICTATHMHG